MVSQTGRPTRFGVVVPSTNTSVEPAFEALRPAGVTNHTARIHVDNIPLKTDADFERLIALAEARLFEAIERVVTLTPDRLILGISSEAIWHGKDASNQLRARIEDRWRTPITLGSDACVDALNAHRARRIAIITPYMPIGDERTAAFFAACGFEIAQVFGFKCSSPQDIAAVTPQRLAEACRTVDGDDIDAILQFGTNLDFVAGAAAAEVWLGKPVIAVNTALYWHALRASGFTGPVHGVGSLFADH